MGHEASGYVHAIGEAVTTVQTGDLIAIEPIAACHACRPCKWGKYNHCEKMHFAGDPQMRHGTLSRYFKLPEEYCWKIPPGTMTPEEAAMLEPLAVAVHTVRGASLEPGSSVVVFGAGTIGLLCAAVAREFGASHIVSVDLNARKCEMVKELVSAPGVVVEAFTPDLQAAAEENARSIVDRLLSGSSESGSSGGFDAVIEATGAGSCIQMGVAVLRVGGSFTEVGINGGGVSVPMLDVVKKEIRLRGSFLYTGENFDLARSLAVRRRIHLSPLISSIFPFGEASEALKAVKEGGGMKTLIQGVDSPRGSVRI